MLLEVLEMKAVVPALANILSNTSMDQEAEARLAQVCGRTSCLKPLHARKVGLSVTRVFSQFG